MHWYAIGPTLTPLERAPAAETPGVVLLTSQELSQLSALPGLEEALRHTPAARDVRIPSGGSIGIYFYQHSFFLFFLMNQAGTPVPHFGSS